MSWLRQVVTRRVFNPEDRDDALGDLLVWFFSDIFPRMSGELRMRDRAYLETAARFRVSAVCRSVRNSGRILSKYRSYRHRQYHVDVENDAFTKERIERNPPKLRGIMRMYAHGLNSADVGRKMGVTREMVRVLKNKMVV